MAKESEKRKALFLTNKELDILGTLIGDWQVRHEMKASTVWNTERNDKFTPKELSVIDQSVKTAWRDKA